MAKRRRWMIVALLTVVVAVVVWWAEPIALFSVLQWVAPDVVWRVRTSEPLVLWKARMKRGDPRLPIPDQINTTGILEWAKRLILRLIDRFREIDEDLNSTGWQDELAPVIVRGVAASNPVWSQVGSTNFWAYKFPDTGTTEQFWSNYHITHNYKTGTELYPHVHFFTDATATGVVRFVVEYAKAKGHNQENFPFASASTAVIDYTMSATPPYRHIISETTAGAALSASSIEPDTVIMSRWYRDNTVGSNYAGSIYAIFTDLHYQIDRSHGTPKRTQFL